jgi:hypothetical protein
LHPNKYWRLTSWQERAPRSLTSHRLPPGSAGPTLI